MANSQRPIQVPEKHTRDFHVNVFVAILIGPFIAAILAGFAFVVVSTYPVTGSIALVVFCTSIFCSYRHGQKQLKLRDRELRGWLGTRTPRQGLAIVAGSVELPPHANPITCEITGRECVAYSFTMQEVKTSGEAWEVFTESRSVPFVIRSQYGTVNVTSPVAPLPSTIVDGGPYADVWFLECNQLTRRSLCTHNGTLKQNYAELMPGQSVTLLGQMAVDPEGGALLEDAEFSTEANPVFNEVEAASRERMLLLHKLGFVISSVYLLWLLFTIGA